MKKILLFSMAAMLLSLSLNAKEASDNAKHFSKIAKTLQVRDNTKPKFMLEDGEYYVGPYTTDAWSASSYNMYNSWDIRNQPMVGVELTPADYGAHIGDEIVGFRFALANTAQVYNFFCYHFSTNDYVDPESWGVTLGSSSSSPATCYSGWNTIYLSEGFEFVVNDTVSTIWIGYQYNITQTNVIAVNPNSTGHVDEIYGYDNYYGDMRWYDMSSKFGGDLAVQLIFRHKSQPAFEGYTELPGTYSDSQNIDLSSITFCDQPWGKTHANNHPAKYTYWLEEVVDANSSDDPHKTNTIDIPVYKTGSDVRGYYNLSEIASDTDHHLQVDVLNADVDMSLQNESMIYYYTLDRGQTRLPNEHIAHLQNNANSNFYTEMSNALGYQGETYTATQGSPALIDRWDHLDVKTGEHNVNYMSYIPVIWAWGDGTLNNKRVDWDNNGVHNSYGSPYYKTGVGDVTFNGGTKIIAQTGTGSTAVWKDGDDDCCLYNVIIDATGYLPTTVNTVDYEPYMFRVWVEGNGLRNFEYDEVNNKFLPADGQPTEILLYEGEYVDNGTGDIRLSVGSEGSDYSNWISFGGLQNITPTLRVRFYYKVPSDNVTSLRGGGRDFYAVENAGYQPEWETGIIENLTGAQVVSTTYVNMQGMQSSKPFDGVNIMVTRYSDGTSTVTKVIK